MSEQLTKKIQEELWVAKYRPKTLDEICLPERLRKRFASGQVDAHLLFAGHQGTGKTTLSRILVQNHTTLFLNGSDDRKLDTVRKKIIDFCSTQSILQHGRSKVVYVEEADKFTSDAQDALKAVIEIYEKNVFFVFTTNHPERFTKPLLSRFEYINFNITNDAEIQDLKLQYGKKIIHILKNEGYKIDQDAIGFLINDVYPDLRKITGLLYSAAKTINKGEFIHLQHLKDNLIVENTSLYDTLIAAYKPEDLFMHIKTNYSGKELDALKSLGEPFLEYLCKNERLAAKVLTASMISHKYNYEATTGDVDPMLTLLACASALSQILK